MRILKLGMAEVLMHMNRPQMAMECMQESYAINDTLHVREAEAKAQELAAEHHDLEQQTEIARQRLWIVTLAIALAPAKRSRPPLHESWKEGRRYAVVADGH